EPGAEPDRLLHQAQVLLGRPLHAHAAAVAAGGALRQVAALEDDDVLEPALGQLVGDAEAHDAAADDGDVALALGLALGGDDVALYSALSSSGPAKSASGTGCTGGREVN